jgi:FAD dependent oxidoreductase TIGR03364
MAEGRVIVVGGGILGTLHALEALDRGFEVVHLEREAAPRGASVRNFGLIWVSGRAPGPELELALVARARWEELGRRFPEVGFRPNGSLTVARTEGERAVMEAVMSRADASDRGLELLDPDRARLANPALGGDLLAALHCSADAVVEPRRVLGAIRGGCGATGRYRWLPGREVTGIGEGSVRDATGDTHRGDLVLLCTGAWHGGVVGEALEGSPVRRVRLQMLETEAFAPVSATALADGDSLRYYPAFCVPELDGLAPQDEVAAEWAAQLLMVQRLHGGLTIGDTHASSEPFAFDVDEAPTRHLLERAGQLLGRPVPPVARRWAGVYSQLTPGAGDALYLREVVAGAVQVVTGPGGRGMTLAPGIAGETFR